MICHNSPKTKWGLPLLRSIPSMLTILQPMAWADIRHSVKFSSLVYVLRFFLFTARSSIVPGTAKLISLQMIRPSWIFVYRSPPVEVTGICGLRSGSSHKLLVIQFEKATSSWKLIYIHHHWNNNNITNVNVLWRLWDNLLRLWLCERYHLHHVRQRFELDMCQWLSRFGFSTCWLPHFSRRWVHRPTPRIVDTISFWGPRFSSVSLSADIRECLHQVPSELLVLPSLRLAHFLHWYITKMRQL